MGLSAPRQIFGIYSVSPYSRTDGTFYGIMKVLASSSLSISGNVIQIYGGANQFAWAAESGQIKAEMNLKPKEFPDFMFTLFFGIAPTTVLTNDNAGTLGTATNVKGTSAVAATGMTATPTVATAANLLFGKFIVVVASATTVNVYFSTDIDFGVKPGAAAYVDDTMKIAGPLTITTGGTTLITGTGVNLIGGASAIAMTTGDTMTFTSQPPSTRRTQVSIGSAKNTMPEFGAILMAQRRGNGELVEIDTYRVKGVGFPIGFDEFKWAESDVKATVLYDTVKDAVCLLRYVAEQ